ncbi:prolyl oligopeptidase family serine peptidase [Hymenobacter weizhouensis]|uniref:prolyl oligopeptidase family serine peptidase n=1 Tax=Hymenobacter sp. YIM 151500-1 TaxID=2987689 RepID=UPI0022260A76|nr:prolyl oligopeptidase family serine peptidase [Hymenobacter sp. YIM 151500-1]UYZ61562.1 prolyl oligopeptidase family serine peptidase [Hymenobacter sp. YIM 151500-1]
MKTACLLTGLLASVAALAQPSPPAAPSVPATDTYFGIKVEDPYRNLENLQDPAVLAWMKAQSDHARRTLDAIPGRQALIDKMVEFDKRKASRVTDLKVADNDRYFYLKSRPQDQQPKLYCRDGYQGQEVLLFDPETFEKGTVFNINGFAPSYDGSKVSFGISEKGSELGRTLILDVKTRKLYPEQLQRNRGGGEWLPDNQSLVYVPFNSDDVKDMAARQNLQCRLHRVGTPQSQDQVLLSAQLYPKLGIRPSDWPYAVIDRDTRLAYGFMYSVDRYLHGYYAPAAALSKPNVPWQPLFKPADEVTNFVTDDQYIYFVTSKNTPRQKIMRMPAARPSVAAAQVLVPESPDEAINDEQLKTTKDGLYFVRVKNGVQAKLYFVPKNSGTVQELKLPQAAGRIELVSKNVQSSDLWATMGGWTMDRKRYRYNVASRQFTPEPLSSEAQYPEFADLVVEEIMVPSHDGVLVPLSIVYKKGLKRDGTAPTLMVGYGAYSISMSPTFMPPYLLWTQQGGILACPHVRGGGELGEAWHKAGQKTTKPNTWKDLIACAEYLTKNNYTAPSKIAINGGSAGGILIGRAMTERPDLFAVAMPEVGCMNAVRMENSPNGPVNTPEFGTMAKEDEAKALLEMDAYHHLKPGTQYPATLVTAGMNDPRVIAWQPAKFAARLQASHTGSKPVLFFTDYDAGHGMGDSRLKQFEGIADLVAFGLWQTGAPAFQPKTAAVK